MIIRNIYALLVAVDSYSNGISCLQGCINDLNALSNYLTRKFSNDHFKLHLLRLENQSATRSAIIKGFDHFKAATGNDICLFYFAGHGSQVPSSDFWESFNGYNQSILCADSSDVNADNDLVDKELSWLIYNAVKGTDPHFLAIMDCCYSGTNTRNGDLISIRQAPERVLARSIKSCEGFKDYVADENGKWSVPKGRHISLAGCKPYQTSKETHQGGLVRGVFTTSLIEVLEEAGELLSYADLEARIAQRIGMRTFDQAPHLDAVAGESAGLGFLNNALKQATKYFIGWNRSAKRWELNAGLISGISRASQLIIDHDDHSPVEIEEVLLDKAIVRATGLSDLSRQYRVIEKPHSLYQRGIYLGLIIDEAQRETFRELFYASNVFNAFITEGPSEAECFVHIVNGSYVFSYTSSLTPLFAPVRPVEGNLMITRFWDWVNIVLRWQYLLDLQNLRPKIAPTEFEVRLYRSDNWQDLTAYVEEPDWQKPSSFCWKEQGGEFVAPGYALQVINKSDRALFFCAMHMSARYGIDTSYLPGQMLAPGKEAWLTATDGEGISHKRIGLTIEDRHWNAGLTEITDYIKLIIAGYEFSSTKLDQPAIDIMELAGSRSGEGARDPISWQGLNLFDGPDWTDRVIPIHIIKPL